MNILFAEDSYLSREIAKCLDLQDENVTVIEKGSDPVAHVVEGLLNQSHYDLIFLFDIQNGTNASNSLKNIRKVELDHDVCLTESSVIVMVTSHREGSFFLNTLYKDCDYFLQLPIDRLKLAIILETTKNDTFLKLPRSA